MAAWNRICCATDFSGPSRVAMREAAELARKFHAELTLIHVYEAPGPASDLLVSPPELFQREIAEAGRTMETWREEAERIAGLPIRTKVVPGHAAEEIVRFVAESAPDLLVMATHGRTGIRHLVMGSVAERVIRTASCPVLVVRGTAAGDMHAAVAPEARGAAAADARGP